MRALGAVALALLLVGCVSPASTTSERAFCPPPCEVAVDTSEDRAFEPVVALHPTDIRHAVLASSVFPRDETAMPDRLKIHVTTDGGATFSTAYFDELLAPTNPVRAYTQWADPRLVWVDDTTLLLFGMAASGAVPETPTLAFTSYDIFVARSPDGGRTWPDGQVIARGVGVMSLAAQTSYNDQPHAVAGPDGTLLAGWVVAESLPDGTTRQDVVAARSLDRGASWSEPVLVASGILHNARPAIAPDGTLYMAYRDYGGEAPARNVLLSESKDQGATWTPVDLGGVRSVSRPSLVADDDGVHLFVAEPIGDALPGVTLVTWNGDAVSRLVLADMQGDGEPLVALVEDGAGGLWATWHVAQPDDTNTHHAWHRSATGETRETRLDKTPIGPNDPQGLIGWPSLGDYMGLAARPYGAVSAWVSGTHDGQDVRAAWLVT